MFIEILKETLVITVFVMVMMLLIEYLSLKSKGNWNSYFQKNPYLQIIFASLMGLMPGCIGAFAVVSLYTHRIISFAALVTAMISTFGDEVFVMLAVLPTFKVLQLSLILLAIAILAGLLIHFFMKDKSLMPISESHFHIHEHEPVFFDKQQIINQFRNITFHRAVLMGGLMLFVTLLLTGNLEHNHGILATHPESATAHESHSEIGFEQIMFVSVALLGLFMVATVPNHFLKHHLWSHVIRKHFLRIFLWTMGAILAIHFLEGHLHVEQWIKDNPISVLLIAVLVGFIPESGPHIVFITLYAGGTIPFSVLIANSIIQDGHGALPLLAESQKSFIAVKLLNALLSLLVGGLGILFGF